MENTQTTNPQTEQQLKMYLADGWQIAQNLPTHYKLKKNTATALIHIVVAICTVWWTLGIGNLIYHLVSNKSMLLPK